MITSFETERGERYARSLVIKNHLINTQLDVIDKRIAELFVQSALFLHDLKQLSSEPPDPDDK